jgi:hypothetical protein
MKAFFSRNLTPVLRHQGGIDVVDPRVGAQKQSGTERH